MTIRITAVPRTNAPNSGYHPSFFAARRNDHVWAIPSKGEYIGDYRNIRYTWCDAEPFKSFFSVRLMRVLAFVAFFFRALRLPRQTIFVHSFIFCIPLWAARQNYALFIHGSDDKYLETRLGAFFAKRAVGIFGVGFELERNGLRVKEIPNVFDLDSLSGAEKSVTTHYEVLFVLREAPVKNPRYPYNFFVNTPEDIPLRIAVVGLPSAFLTDSEAQKIAIKTNANRSIDYLGRCSFDQVGQLMKSSAVMILPSHSEGVAKSMLEALSSGMHVIVSDKLRLPFEFEAPLIRVDLENWKEVLNVIRQCKDSGLSQANIDFVNNYLKRSISLLDEVYADLARD